MIFNDFHDHKQTYNIKSIIKIVLFLKIYYLYVFKFNTYMKMYYLYDFIHLVLI